MMRRRRKASQSDDENEEFAANASDSEEEGSDLSDEEREPTETKKEAEKTDTSVAAQKDEGKTGRKKRNRRRPSLTQDIPRDSTGAKPGVLWEGDREDKWPHDGFESGEGKKPSRRGRGSGQRSGAPPVPRSGNRDATIPQDAEAKPKSRPPRNKGPKQFRKKGDEETAGSGTNSATQKPKFVRYSETRQQPRDQQQEHQPKSYNRQRGQQQSQQQYIPKSQNAEHLESKMGQLQITSKPFVPRSSGPGDLSILAESPVAPFPSDNSQGFGYPAAFSHNTIQYYPIPDAPTGTTSTHTEWQPKPRSHAIPIVDPDEVKM